MQDKSLQIKHVIEDRICLIEKIKEGEKAKLKLEDANQKLKELLEVYLEEMYWEESND